MEDPLPIYLAGTEILLWISQAGRRGGKTTTKQKQTIED